MEPQHTVEGQGSGDPSVYVAKQNKNTMSANKALYNTL